LASCRTFPLKQKNTTKDSMDKKSRLLTPLVVTAALSVVAFAGVGVAAITGHLSITQLSPNPLVGFAGTSKSSSAVVAPAAAKARPKAIARNQAAGAKPIDFKPGTRVNAGGKSKCEDCGVVDSIRAKEVEKAGIIAAGMNDTHAQDPLSASGRASGLTYAALNGTGNGPRVAVNFVLTLRMEDGTVRTIYENQRPPFSIGERVRLINGSIVPLG
jgi:outer membrane lipoprotein SlyB